MTPQEKIAQAILLLQREKNPALILTEDERADAIADLAARLHSIPRGERSNSDGRKIRSRLRKLGFYISRQMA